eukprot:246649-Alexandrium_andersonii.AAC.1
MDRKLHRCAYPSPAGSCVGLSRAPSSDGKGYCRTCFCFGRPCVVCSFPLAALSQLLSLIHI